MQKLKFSTSPPLSILLWRYWQYVQILSSRHGSTDKQSLVDPVSIYPFPFPLLVTMLGRFHSLWFHSLYSPFVICLRRKTFSSLRIFATLQIFNWTARLILFYSTKNWKLFVSFSHIFFSRPLPCVWVCSYTALNTLHWF